MKRVTVRGLSVELPGLSDDAELARVQSLDAQGGSLSSFELAGSRMRALDVKNMHLIDGRVRALRTETAGLMGLTARSVEFAAVSWATCGGLEGSCQGPGAQHLRRVVIDRAQLLQLAEALGADLEVSFGDDA